MAAEKEEHILEFKVDQKDALTELEQLKKSITGLKEEQKTLNKAYKEGNVTLDEYAQDSVRLESILKKQQVTYNNVQKSVTGHKSKIDELIKSQNKLGQSFQDAANDINVAGVSVGSLTTKLASFANPATAAVGIVSALGAAYASSTIGAKDLEFAQNQLAAATSLVSNQFASLISSSEDGEGLFSSITDEILQRVSPALAALAKMSAANIEALEDAGRKEIEVRDQVNQRLGDNQELLTEIQAEQTKYNEKIDKSNEIITNFKRNEEELKAVLEEELKLLNFQLSIDEKNEAVQTAVLQKKREISNLERDTEKRVQGIVRLQQNINEAHDKDLKKLREERDIQEQIRKSVEARGSLSSIRDIGPVAGSTDRERENESIIKDGTLSTIDSEKVNAQAVDHMTEAIKRQTEAIEKNRQTKQKETDNFIQAENAKLAAAESFLGSLGGMFESGSNEAKTFALASIGFDTAKAIASLVAASNANPANSVTFGGAGAGQYAAGLIQILSNIATAMGYINSFAGGGYTGPGFGRPDSSGFKRAGVVHEGEYVAPKRVVNSSIGQHHISALENLRLKGYADGGLVKNSMTSQVDQMQQTAQMTANIMKSMPPIYTRVKDVRDAIRKAELRDNYTGKR